MNRAELKERKAMEDNDEDKELLKFHKVRPGLELNFFNFHFSAGRERSCGGRLTSVHWSVVWRFDGGYSAQAAVVCLRLHRCFPYPGKKS